MRLAYALLISLGLIFSSFTDAVNETRGSAPPARPNIIYILADDLGYGDLGCYGQTKIQTPNLDRMAAQGMRFTNHYAGSTVCAPSRGALMTGLHIGHARVKGNDRTSLRPDDVTVAEVLKQAGYTTGLIGKWGLGEEGTEGIPTKQGFDYFYGYLNQVHAHNYYPHFLWRNTEKVPLKNEVTVSTTGEGKGLGGVATKKVDYTPDLFTQEGLQFVEKNQKKPFFLYLAYTIPHANNEAKEKGMEVPSNELYADRDWPEAQKNKAAMISRMDRAIGQLLAKLEALGIANNTLIIFSSDNGPHKEGGADPHFLDSNGKLRGIKRDLYDGGIRVPMIAYWPGTISSGKTTDHVSAFWDVMPTLADIAGAPLPGNVSTDGISFAPTLLGKSDQKKHNYLYWQFNEGAPKQAIRMNHWKAVWVGENAPELYDLATDEAEATNVASQHADVLKKADQYRREAGGNFRLSASQSGR